MSDGKEYNYSYARLDKVFNAAALREGCDKGHDHSARVSDKSAAFCKVEPR